MEPVSADSFLERYCAMLGFDEELTEITAKVAARSGDIEGIAGRCPLSIAGASIYMTSLAMGKAEEKKKIATIVGVAEVTITNSLKLMHFNRKMLFKDCNFYKNTELLIDSMPSI
jgi:transcription initiation factor TFIIIB Brf1 subunit/transcription initiation factor TFIIB